MTQQDNLAKAFDRQSGSFDGIYSGKKNALSRTWDRLTRQNIQKRHTFTIQAGEPWSGQRVLDVGCGSGRYCIDVARRGARSVVGLDLSADMLQLGRELAEQAQVHEQCEFVQADILEYDDQEGFDTIIANGFFDYIPEPAAVFGQLRKLSRRTFIATFPARWAFRAPFRVVWWAINGCRLRFYSEASIKRLCEGAGFVSETIVKQGPIFLLVARVDDASA